MPVIVFIPFLCLPFLFLPIVVQIPEKIDKIDGLRFFGIEHDQGER